MKKQGIPLDGVVVPMKDCDGKDVILIYGMAIREGNSTVVTECPDWKQWDQDYMKEGRFVCKIQGRVRGFVALKKVSLDHQTEIYTISIYVHPEYRKRGLGTELLKAAVRYGDRSLEQPLYSLIFSDNLASIGLHWKLGFRQVPGIKKVVLHRNHKKEIWVYERECAGYAERKYRILQSSCS